MHTIRRPQSSKLRFISGPPPPLRAQLLWLRRRLLMLIIAATVTAVAAIAFLAPDMLLLLLPHVPKTPNQVIDCVEPTVVRPATQRAMARDRTLLSTTEPLDFRTIVDGNYLPRITQSWPAGFDPYDETGREEKILPCTPVLQRGHIVVYTPAEVREILAGRGRFEGRIRPSTPSHHWQQACMSSSIPEAAAAFARPPIPLPVAAGGASNTTSTTSSSSGINSSDSTISRSSAGHLPNVTTVHDGRASSDNGDDAQDGNQQEQQQQLPTYTPVVIFADLGYGDEKSMYFENVASEWVLHTVFTPRDTNAFIAAVFFHRQNLSEAFDMDAAREYLRIPGVARVMTTYLISDRRVESCSTVQRLADFVQPHMLIATGDEKATRHCTAKVLSQKCYGADKRCGYGQCALPVTLAEFSSHGTPGVAHVPTWTWPRAEPRAMRRADAPAPPPGWVEFYGWPLPHGISAWDEMYTWGFVCQTYERKIPPPPPAGTYTNENLRPLPCYDLTSRDCLLAPHPKMPSADLDMACPPPPPSTEIDDYYAFPSRHAFPYVLPPLDRPRRLAWSLIGSRLYGDRNSAVRAFSAAFSGIPFLVDDKGFGRFDALSRVVSDSVFVPIGGGNCAYETARAFEVMRVGAIPVVATGAAWSAALGSPSAVPDPASAFTTLLGFEGRWPDGWLVARTWPEAAAMARRVLETPGEVVRLRRLVLASYAVLREAMHQRTRLAMSRSVDPAHFWDEAAANLTLSE